MFSDVELQVWNWDGSTCVWTQARWPGFSGNQKSDSDDVTAGQTFPAKLPTAQNGLGVQLEFTNIAIRLTLDQNHAGVIAQTRSVGVRTHFIEQALGGGVRSQKMLLQAR
jgi:hypothetical protein